MAIIGERDAGRSAAVSMLSKVPEVTIFFWVIKVLATTVGETGADFLNTNLNMGLTGTTVVVGGLLAAVLYVQFRARRYVPGIYWLAVVLISVAGTLFTDNLVDHVGISLMACTIAFAVALAVTFGVWYSSEKTLSIHSITSSKREGFYWAAILFTFALGTAAGDLVAERFGLGYWKSALLFAAVIGLVAVAHYRYRLNAVLAFWIAYILTRPLGASSGDYLSQSTDVGGLALGTVGTSAIFVTVIVAVVVYLSVEQKRVAVDSATIG